MNTGLGHLTSWLSGFVRITGIIVLLLTLGACGPGGRTDNGASEDGAGSGDGTGNGSGTGNGNGNGSDNNSDQPGITQLSNCAGIMPLGDSITLGVNGGYRNNLYTGLQQNNCGVSYAGTLIDPNTRVPDKAHEGHPLYTIDNIASHVDAWIASTQPNIILLMIGTNDTAWWTVKNADEIGARHNALVDQLKQDRPDAWIFVASIPPQTSEIIQPNNIDRAVLARQFNAVIRENVASRPLYQHVRFVDVYSVLTTADLYDGIHPTEEAHAKVAQKFLDEIRAALGIMTTSSRTRAGKLPLRIVRQ